MRYHLENHLATQSGLTWATIRRYAKSELLERGPEDEPIYMHRAACPIYCNYACNGGHGNDIAVDVGTLENWLPDGKLAE